MYLKSDRNYVTFSYRRLQYLTSDNDESSLFHYYINIHGRGGCKQNKILNLGLEKLVEILIIVSIIFKFKVTKPDNAFFPYEMSRQGYTFFSLK